MIVLEIDVGVFHYRTLGDSSKGNQKRETLPVARFPDMGSRFNSRNFDKMQLGQKSKRYLDMKSLLGLLMKRTHVYVVLPAAVLFTCCDAAGNLRF